jgi:hypothetical protein
MPTKQPWTAGELDMMRNVYPHVPASDLAAMLARPIKSIYQKAHDLGLKKSAYFMASDHSGRVQRGKHDPRMIATRFKPGAAAWNKGIAGSTGHHPACKATQFKPGTSPANTMPIGARRIVSQHKGQFQQLEAKTSAAKGNNSQRWTPVARLVWQAAHGPVPSGCIVVFKPGTSTTVEAHITLDKLECITRAENARRNHPRERSPELGHIVQLKGAITRQVNRITREHQERQAA